MKKSLYDISLKITEEEYRKDPALSYSTLAKYERDGFGKLDSLFELISTPSLTFGSAVDSILTGGEEEFNDRFMVAEFPGISDAIVNIVMALFSSYSTKFSSLKDIDDKHIIDLTEIVKYQLNWKPETRAKVIKEKGSEYYSLLYLSVGKTIISTSTYNNIMNAVDVLKNSPATKYYFMEDNPFDNIERLYQLKFKATLNGIDYRNMADLIIVDHDKKTVLPCDLKTSGKAEYDFYKSFVQWRYDIQARLYWRIIRDNMDKDDYFKDFELLDYKFIVVNKSNLDPMVWDFPVTKSKGTLTFKDGTVMRDPEEIGKELHYYLTSSSKRPIGIQNENNICEWLNK